MSAASLADRLVREEMLTQRVKQPEARANIALEAGIAPGSLENLGRGRLKKTDWIAEKLNVLRINRLEKRIASLKRDLAAARAMGHASQVDLGRAESAISGAEAALREARQALGQA